MGEDYYFADRELYSTLLAVLKKEGDYTRKLIEQKQSRVNLLEVMTQEEAERTRRYTRDLGKLGIDVAMDFFPYGKHTKLSYGANVFSGLLTGKFIYDDINQFGANDTTMLDSINTFFATKTGIMAAHMPDYSSSVLLSLIGEIPTAVKLGQDAAPYFGQWVDSAFSDASDTLNKITFRNELFGSDYHRMQSQAGFDYAVSKMNRATNLGYDKVSKESLVYWLKEAVKNNTIQRDNPQSDYIQEATKYYGQYIDKELKRISEGLNVDLKEVRKEFAYAIEMAKMPYAGEAVYANGQMAWGADATALLKDSTTAIKENAEATKNLVEEKQNLASSQEVINSLLADSATAADQSTEAIKSMTAAQYWQQQNAALAEYVDELLHHNEVIKVTQADWNALKVKVEDFESPDLIDEEDWAEAIQEEYNAHYIPFSTYINNDMDVAPYNNSNQPHYLSNESLDRCKAAA